MLELCKKCIDRLGIHGVREVEGVKCMLCSGLLWRIESIAREVIDSLQDYEFDTFQVGCRLEGSIKALEEYIFEKYGNGRRSIKYEFNRELSKAIAKLTGKRPSREPDVTIIYNVEKETFQVQVAPLYIYGRYKKRVRGIPQTRWICSACNGKGCEACNFTGKKYPTSVEELIAEPCKRLAEGSFAILHGAGREDVDARMLGNGRPFIVEIREPKKRKIDLKALERIINEEAGGKVAVCCLKFAKAKDVEFIKNEKFKKVYRAVVEFDREVSEEELEKAISNLSNRTIEQFTPKRVEHRRTKLLRRKRTYDLRLLLHKGRRAIIEIEAESGLYIKELISGDEGRTKPSLSEVLNSYARVAKLDVIRVEGGID